MLGEMPVIFFLLSAGLVDSALGQQSRIVNGMEVNISSYPFIAALRQGPLAFCGGSIISSNAVLSAAHCMTRIQTGNDCYIEVGATKIGVDEQRYYIESVIVHENFNSPKQGDDIAIIRIVGKLKFGPHVQLIALATPDVIVPAGEEVIIMGYGSSAQRLKTIKESEGQVLHAAVVPIVDNADCQAAYESHNRRIRDEVLCASLADPPTDTCQGDSGGPLIIGNIQIGIVSWGFGCADPLYPGVYTRISSYYEWIVNNL